LLGTQRPRPLAYQASKLLTYRQRVRLAILRELREELQARTAPAGHIGRLPDGLIEARMSRFSSTRLAKAGQSNFLYKTARPGHSQAIDDGASL
jgi:hypothetical protein